MGNKEQKKLNCFVYGTMDLEDTSNLFDGKFVFIKASGMSTMKVEMETLKDFISENINYSNYSDIHNFCTDFLRADIQGLISEKDVQSLIDD
jgi:hypothetical protein